MVLKYIIKRIWNKNELLSYTLALMVNGGVFGIKLK